jgi:hypothetical protein
MEESKDDEAIQESGCRLLSTLSNGDRGLKLSLKASNAYDAMVESFHSRRAGHSRKCQLIRLCLKRHWYLVQRAMKAMNAFADIHKEDPTLLMSICGFAANACNIPETKASEFPVEGIARSFDLPAFILVAPR